MNIGCWLSMAEPALSEAEVLILLQAQKKEIVDDLLVVEAADWHPLMRAAYTKAAYEIWFSGSATSVWDLIDKFEWNKHVQGTFAVSVHHGKGITNKQVADRIWHWLKDPHVNLKQPDTGITFFFVGNKVVCGRFLWANKEQFSKRRPHLRVKHSPISADPWLSRCMVNLTGAPIGARVLDPFCGTGGLLIEAGLMGMHPHGSDINEDMVKKAKANCRQFGLQCHFQAKDAMHIYSPEKYVVADLPYGRASGKKHKKALQELYLAFMERLAELLRVRAVLACPHTIDMRVLARKAGLKVMDAYLFYVHKTLTRKIVVLEPVRKRT